MTPRLYDGSTGFNGNGIGALPDCVSCTVTEQRNGSFELALEYPVDGLHYESLRQRALVRAKPNPFAEEQYFRIYKISRPMNGIVTVYARHISYDLSGVPVDPCSANRVSTALAALQSAAAVPCDFTLWTDKNTQADFAVTEPRSMRSALGGAEGSILEVYGGEFEWDNHTVKLHGSRGQDRGVSIRYGKNLLDVKQEENCAELYTGIYPYYTDSEDAITQLPEKIVNAPGTYDFTRVLTVDLSAEFEDTPSADALREAAEKYIESNRIGVPTVNLTVSFAQLEQTEEYKSLALLERVGLCDTVHVRFDRLGVQADAKVITTTYNVLRDRYDSVELGDAKATLADTVSGIAQDTQQAVDKTKSALEKAIDRATQLITGNLGGHVVLHTGADGTPDELLIMDTTDINTATKVWRHNLSGWGYSNTGYNGQYRLAATMDGAINADFITAGTLTADLIRSGVLASLDGEAFYLDMATGDLRANFKTLTLGSKTVETTEGAATKISNALTAYSTTVEMNSAIQQSADSINLSVGQKITTTLQDYSTTVEMNSAIQLGVSEIRLSVQNNGTTSSISLKNGETVIDTAEVKITGFLTVGNLTDGVTTISGNNIKTGSISADRISGGTIDASKITVDNLDINKVKYGDYPVIECSGSPPTITVGKNRGWFATKLALNGKNVVISAEAGRTIAFGASGYTDPIEIYVTNSSYAYLRPAQQLQAGYTGGSSYAYLGDSTHYFRAGYVNEMYTGAYNRIGHSASAKVGFFGTSPIVKKTVNTVATSAASSTIAGKVNEVINALKGYGLL